MLCNDPATCLRGAEQHLYAVLLLAYAKLANSVDFCRAGLVVQTLFSRSHIIRCI